MLDGYEPVVFTTDDVRHILYKRALGHKP